jgi:hypothetical protein
MFRESNNDLSQRDIENGDLMENLKISEIESSASSLKNILNKKSLIDISQS